uniref:meiosis-specific with OB domain-containing protein isoform X1 n=1 Tax=Scatophagus argus TaxID=75038 RepID=UPI001ED843EB|nr:meiosis-specific with OB domain-containing protein isoform X1 [Scatophagus argus]XP_046233902.1 meiosis-specific with OB domain-containing protein isoform X1 [Scatophagus argus]XP_046233903.1 meiosis-specific with OB domain-containing protein isoform X1 [Scatophagus argus]XP_046233904.1 meiosis-specific with OB domain-containing protein isoform X1 [Scatophagus argus]
MAAQTYIAISELHPNFSHPKVAGIIIGKTDVKSFPDRKNIGMDRFTFGFTVKDSPDFFINVTAWGNDEYINGLSSSFSIGDCVIIENPLVANKDPEKGDRFCPTTPSLYRLLVTEAHSQVCLCADMDTNDRLLPLIHLPVKDSRDFYSLGDIVANGQRLDGAVINILAAVKLIGEPKQFTTSDRRKGQRLEVKLFDDSVSSFPLVCWDREAIQLVQTLIPKETVLFIADAKISFDSFRNGMTATVNSKTIITVNPDTREASVLFSYAKEASESGALDQDEKSEDETVDSITDVYTVSQLKKKAQENPETFFGITYSFISKLDLDSSVSKVIRTRCSRCKFQVTEDVHSCTNQFCPGRDEAFSATSGFDLLVDFTDHTGTLHSCTLRSPVAEKTLGCTTEEFTSLTDDQRTAMKWKFLLERCKIYIKILPSTKTKSGIRGVVLACSLADPGEVKQHMSALLHRL